jgi:hypothetical protein
MSTVNYLVFGDLHGRILQAFRFASYFAREFSLPISAMLQVGDLGYFPDLSRMDKATMRHAKDDPSELGVQDVIRPTAIADAVLENPDCPAGMWFTLGNHEDYETLERLASAAPREPDFVVDHYCKILCIQNGGVSTLPGELRVGALWGVDGESPHRRTNLPKSAYIRESKATQLLGESFQVLLTHDAPFGAKRPDAGSQIIHDLIALAQPEFAFFGHYHGEGSEIHGQFSRTRLFHMSGFELHGRDGTADPGSVGLLQISEQGNSFEFIENDFLKRFSRYNWKHL